MRLWMLSSLTVAMWVFLVRRAFADLKLSLLAAIWADHSVQSLLFSRRDCVRICGVLHSPSGTRLSSFWTWV